MKNLGILVFGAGLAWAYGCGGKGNTATPGAGGAAASSTATVTSTSVGPTPASSSTGMMMDEGTSCADAVALEAKMNSQGGTFYDRDAVIGTPGDIDYFKFDVKKGDWIRLGTAVDVNVSAMNSVITLYDATGKTQLAQDNNVIGGSNTVESELFYHAVTDGTLCLKVEDFSTFSGGKPAGGDTYTYRATLVPIDFKLYDYYDVDVEPNNDTASAQKLGFSVDPKSKQIDAGLAGLFDKVDDVDTYTVTAPQDVFALNVLFTPAGPQGFGSTQSPGIVDVYKTSATGPALASLDVQKGASGLSQVPVKPGDPLLLQVHWPQGKTAGANDFYFLKIYTSTGGNPQEKNDAANSDPMAAEATTGTLDMKTTHFYVGGTLPANDTDWWSFTANTGDSIALACSSWRAGSGVRDATFSFYLDPKATALQTETEVETKSVLWSTATAASKKPYTATATGKHYLQVMATKHDANVTSDHYLCGIHVTAP